MAYNWKKITPPILTISGAFWRHSRWLLIIVTAVVLLSAATSIAAPYIFSRLIDNLDHNNTSTGLLLGFGLYAILLGAAAALQNIAQYMSLVMSENLSFIAATSFFKKLVRKTTSFFIDHNPAEIQSAQSRGESSLNILIQLGILVFAPGILQMIFTLALLGAVINIEIVVIVFIYGTCFITFTYFANKWTRKYLDAAISASQENAKFVGNAVVAMDTLRQFGSSPWIISRFATKAATVRDSWRKFATYRVGYVGVFGSALAVQFMVTFLVLLPRYEIGELSIGDIVLFNTLLLQLNRPFEMIGNAIDNVVQSLSGFAPFADMWASPEEKDTDGKNQKFLITDGTLVFKNICFDYGNKKGVRNINFSANRGQVTFITGETGAGKSTLFKLALKSIEADSGIILADGVDLHTVSRTDWFSQIGVVPQDIVLLNDTLGENIVLGRAHDVTQLRRAAKRASILNFIESLPDGFETNIGERGLKLSGGERQRIAIARALYANPQILFLDEASAALDEKTETEIMSHLHTYINDMTIIAITHRKSVIKPVDKVYDLNSNTIITPS